MPAQMTKTNSYLKGLAETRARADGDVLRLERLLAEITADLSRAKSDRDACDRLIRRFDPALNPEAIEPIQAQKGLYGKHGGLTRAVENAVRSAAPTPITTWEVGLAAAMELKLEFVSRKDRSEWMHNTLGRCLRRMLDQGTVERVADVFDENDQARTRWRWLGVPCTTLDDLRRQAAAKGVTTAAEAAESDS